MGLLSSPQVRSIRDPELSQGRGRLSSAQVMGGFLPPSAWTLSRPSLHVAAGRMLHTHLETLGTCSPHPRSLPGPCLLPHKTSLEPHKGSARRAAGTRMGQATAREALWVHAAAAHPHDSTSLALFPFPSEGIRVRAMPSVRKMRVLAVGGALWSPWPAGVGP